MKETIKRSLYFLALIIGSILFSIITQSIAIIGIRMVTSDTLAELAVTFAVAILTAFVMLCILTAREGEKLKNGVNYPKIAISAAIAVGLQTLIAIPFDFVVYTAGGAGSLARIFHGNFEENFKLGDTPIGLGVLAMLICGAVYIGAFLLGHYLGHRRYLAERSEFRH